MLGHDGTRNSVSLEEGPPLRWCSEQWNERDKRLVRPARGIRWSAPLGTWATFSSPVIASGLLWIGTNANGEASGRASVLKCFRVLDGKLLYEYSSPPFGDSMVKDSAYGGIGASPLIEDDRLWMVTNRSEVLCLDIGPLIRDEGMPRQLWKLDMIAELDVFHRIMLMGPLRPCSIGPSVDGRIFVTTSNGVDRDRVTIPKPDAPSVVCLDKNSGKVLWKDNSPGANILTTQFSSPTIATIDNQVQVIVPQSDGWLRSFRPESGEILWEFDLNLKTSHFDRQHGGGRNYPLANAVVYEGRVYIGCGREPDAGEGSGRLVCIDPTKRGDISSELAVDTDGKLLPRRRVQAVVADSGERAIANPNSGLVWEFTECGKTFEDQMHRTMSSVVIHKGLLIALDFSGLAQCFDAKTGVRHWSHDLLAACWCSPLIVGDKVYIGDEDGEIAIFQLGAEPSCAEPLVTMLQEGVYANPVYANGTLYIASGSKLEAIDANLARQWIAESANWTQWRGPRRDNRSTDTNLLPSWPAEGPPLVWRADGLGDGIASIAIADGRVVTSTTYGLGEYVLALDEATGERLWESRVADSVRENPLMRWLSQRTPTIDGERIFSFTNRGELVCLDTASGVENWKLNYATAFAAKQGKWGFCDRPLVDGNVLVCTPGGAEVTVAALNKQTGEVLWKTLIESREQAGYGASVIVETNGLRQYVVVLEKGIASFAADDGRRLWRYDGVSSATGNTYTPLVVTDGLLCVNGYQGAVARLKLMRRGNEVLAEPIFHQPRPLDPFEDSTVEVDGRLYAFQSGGYPLCIDIRDGSTLWGPVRPALAGKSAATYADGHLFVHSVKGGIALVVADAKEYIEKSRFTLPDPREAVGATFPVVAGGRLYVRDNDRLYCFDVSKRPDSHPPLVPKLVNLPSPRDKSPARSAAGRGPDAVFVPTPQDVVQQMLAIAKLTKDDVLYDLGSGDGRIVIEAAKKYGSRSVGIEIKRDLVDTSVQRSNEANVNDLATFREGDLFTTDFGEATVVIAYLFPALLERLIPKFEQLKPGTRIVTHQFAIPGRFPEETLTIESKETGDRHSIYVWTMPFKK